MHRKISINAAWAESAEFLRRERRLVVPVLFALLVVPAILASLVEPSAQPGSEPRIGWWTWISLASLIVSVIGQMTIVRLAMGTAETLADTIRLACRRAWLAIAALFLFSFAFALVSIPFLVILELALGRGGAPGAGPTRLTALLFAAAVLAAVPRSLPVLSLAMAEPRGPWKLLRRSWALTKGHYWPLAGFFVTFMLGALVLAVAVQFIVGSLVTLSIGPSDPMTLARLVVAAAGAIVAGIAQLLYSAMLGRMTLQLLSGDKSGT